ncbi:MAG: VanZ family protein [Chromatiales bacterium]|nr:VanZ family protein [Chromatiales bacterium]
MIRLLALAVLTAPLFLASTTGWLRHVPPEAFAVGHVVYFLVAGLLILNLPQLRGRSPMVQQLVLYGIVLAASLLIEALQSIAGRSASLRDIALNLAGASLAALWALPSGWFRILTLMLGPLAVSLLLYNPVLTLMDRGLARIQHPVLGDFETALEVRRWSRGTRDDTISRSGRYSLRLDLQPGPFPGTMVRRSLGRWSAYDCLAMSVFNPDPEPLPLTISIRDHEHFRRGGAYADRYNATFTIHQGWNDLSIPLTQVRNAPRARRLDLDQIAEFVMFSRNLEHSRTLYLDRVQLGPSGPGDDACQH